MIKIEQTNVSGWKAAIRGLRNPMNSWKKSDSYFFDDGDMLIGEADYDLMNRMNVSPEQSKYRRMINVTMDITAPLYWWKEFDTYKVGTVANSCSTMHKIQDKEFTLDDFSHEHLSWIDIGRGAGAPLQILKNTIWALNDCRELYMQTKDKDYWWQMIQLLPSSYNQKRTVQLNYEVLANIYHSRRNHKLDEWHTLCSWINSLPHSALICGAEEIYPSESDHSKE